jgi:hypothetical protein
MGATESVTKSPPSPFFKGEFSPENFNPSLEKHALSRVEGRGRRDLLPY